MTALHPLAIRVVGVVILPIVAATALSFVYLRRSLPETNRQEIVTRVSTRVDLVRDQNGVAIIEARRDRDAFFAIGFAHAQDRLWQMEIQRRTAAGRLAEVLGEESVRQDAWMRTLGLYDVAQSSWDGLSDEARAALTAYADGVNAWLEQATVLPPEFMALGVRPEPWREVDSLAWSKVFALGLANNMWKEAANLVACDYLTADQLADLMSGDQGPPPCSAPPGEGTDGAKLASLLVVQRNLQEQLKIGGPHVGSNAWVVSGALMQGGGATVANDTHLAIQLPSLWYAARLKGDRLDVAGMTLVGLPVVIFGRNRDVAWGGAVLPADVQDLYLEQTHPQDPTRYRHGDQWLPFTTRFETIRVKAAFPASLRPPEPPKVLRVRSTVDGPLISDAITGFDQPVALRWTALEPGDQSFESFFRAGYATDWQTFQEAFRSYVAPALTLVYADRQNNIASLGIGRVPIRAKGNGRLPMPGWTTEYRWTGSIPFDQMPKQLNPPAGFIVSANQRSVGQEYPYFLSSDWAEPNRANRIAELLTAKSGKRQLLSVDDMARMQEDTVDVSVRALLAHLRQHVTPTRPEQQEPLRVLGEWNGDMAKDSQAASIFFVWMRHLRDRLFGDVLREYWNRSTHSTALNNLVEGASHDQILTALTTHQATWCRQRPATGAERCAAVLSQSLDEAIGELTKLRGGRVASWKWGDLHEARYTHLPFSQVNLLAPIFERTISTGGSPNTINVANAIYAHDERYTQTVGAAFRQIVQMRAPIEHRFINSTGQSGNPLSGHYADMVRPFHEAGYRTLPESATGSDARIILTPERTGRP